MNTSSLKLSFLDGSLKYQIFLFNDISIGYGDEEKIFV